MYQPHWESLKQYQVPDWFKDDKLGIFIHWGVYAVPAFDNEWYPRFMYQDENSRRGVNYYQHHLKTYGHPGTFGYKDFIPMFKGERWDPAEWVELFKAAGARYVVPVAEHHDGFAMYGTEFTPWNSARMGPKRDVIQELATAVRAATGAAKPNLFVSVAPDGIVTLTCARAEMGQGVRSGIPMILADELGADWSRVKIWQAPVSPARSLSTCAGWPWRTMPCASIPELFSAATRGSMTWALAFSISSSRRLWRISFSSGVLKV